MSDRLSWMSRPEAGLTYATNGSSPRSSLPATCPVAALSSHDHVRRSIRRVGVQWDALVVILGQDNTPSESQGRCLARAVFDLAKYSGRGLAGTRISMASKVFVRTCCTGTELELHWKEVDALTDLTPAQSAHERRFLRRALCADGVTDCSVYRYGGGLDVRLFFALNGPKDDLARLHAGI